jgi:hypothetical protein
MNTGFEIRNQKSRLKPYLKSEIWMNTGLEIRNQVLRNPN